MHLVDQVDSGLLHGYRRFLRASICEGPILLVLHVRELDKNDTADREIFPLLDLIAGTIA